MAKTFKCPHCGNSYPVLPTLVGRKVRCSYCKKAFELQYDGTALKVSSGATVRTQQSSRALEKRRDSSVEDSHQPESHTGVRPQTRAIKRHTERIKKIRDSLQSAAAQAADHVTSGDSGVAGKPKQPATTLSAAGDEGKADRSAVVLSHAGQRQRHVNRIIVMVFAGCVLLFLGWFSMISGGPAEAALERFVSAMTVEDSRYPTRMNVYRERMWIYTRDGVEQPPIILNADDSVLSETDQFNWAEVIAACSPELDGLFMNRSLAIWHRPADLDIINQAWSAYENKVDVGGFYAQLERHDYSIVRFEHLQSILLKKGVRKEAIYVLSLLLAGTRNAAGEPCSDFGLRSDVMPAKLLLTAFSGRDGRMLIDAGGFYSSSDVAAYSGLIAGFTEFTGVSGRADEWRVLDLRTESGFDQFYSAAYNPLQLLSQRVHEDMRAQMQRADTAATAGVGD